MLAVSDLPLCVHVIHWVPGCGVLLLHKTLLLAWNYPLISAPNYRRCRISLPSSGTLLHVDSPLLEEGRSAPR